MRKNAFAIFLFSLVMVNLIIFPNFNSSVIAANVVKLRFANYFPPPSAQSKICEDFVAEVEKRTNGRIQIQYFKGGSLLGPTAMFEGIITGIADIGFAPTIYNPGRFPVTQICDLPLGYPCGWVSNQVVNDFFWKFRPKEWNTVHVLWLHAGSPMVMVSTKPIRKLEDLKGTIIRAPGLIGDTIKALGAIPAPTPAGEMYDALEKNVITGVNLPLEVVKNHRLGEVAKYVTMSWQAGNIIVCYVVMNKNSYKKIPPDLKEIFDILCGEFQERTALMWNATDFDGLRFGKQEGVEFINLSPAEAQRWKEAVAPIVESYVKKLVKSGHPEAEVRSWLDFIRKRIDYWTKEQIVNHIKSAMGPPELCE